MGVRLKQCSCLHLQASPNMAPCGKAVLLLLLVEGGLGARTLRGNAARDQRSLANTFPFNSNEGADAHHGDHHGHHGEGHHDARNPSLQLLLPVLVLTARGVLTRSRWWRRSSMTMLSSATTPTTGGATPPMSPTTSPSRRRTVRRTSGRTVSSNTSRSPSTKLLRSAGPLSLRIVISRDLIFAGPSTNPSAGPSRRFTMLRTMWLSAPLRLRRSVRTRPLDTPPTPSAPSGPGRFAASPRSQ